MKKSMLTMFLGVATLFCAVSGMHAGEVIADWQFKDATNPGKDSSAAGNNLKLVGGSPKITAGEMTLKGGPTGGVKRDQREYFTCTNEAFNLNDTSFTVECWFKSPTVNYMKLVGTRSTIRPIYKNQFGWAIGLDKASGSISFVLNDKDKKVTVAKTKIIDSTWDGDELNYLVGVRDIKAKTLKLYVNGELVATVTDKCGDISRKGRLDVGFDMYAGYITEGTFAEIKITKGLLTKEEIAKKFKAGPAK